jgi:hypothetical protein
MKTHDWIALYLLLAITLFGVLSYFFSPKDAETAKLVNQALIDSLGMVLAFKFGVHVATPPAGSNQITETKVPPLAPEEAKKEAEMARKE